MANRVRFQDVDAKGRSNGFDLSPPRMPKSSPSYLIWSIFTKEREEREKMRKSQANSQTKRRSKGRNSPLSRMPVKDEEDMHFESTLLNAKLAELEKEVTHFREENVALQVSKRKLASARKKLAQEVEEFEAAKAEERGKVEEERRRVRRERALMEKAQRRGEEDNKANSEEAAALQEKMAKLKEEMDRKESKWSASLAKLQEQVKYLERENKQLHEENHAIKLKLAAPKVSTNLSSASSNRTSVQVTGIGRSSAVSSRSSNLEAVKNNSGEGGSGDVSRTLEAPRMTFSPAESLDSDVTLVSNATVATNNNVASPSSSSSVEVASRSTSVARVVSSQRNEVTKSKICCTFHAVILSFRQNLGGIHNNN